MASIFRRTALDEWSAPSLSWAAGLCRRSRPPRGNGRWRRRWTPSARLGVHNGDQAIARATAGAVAARRGVRQDDPQELMNNVIALTMRDERSGRPLEPVREARWSRSVPAGVRRRWAFC